MNEMPILKALRQLVKSQITKPEWVRWTNDPEHGWEFTLDGFGGDQWVSVDFNGLGGNVRVIIDDDIREANYDIPWADPECDLKVANLINEWLVKMWDENYLDRAGYPNPISGATRKES